MLLTKIIYVSDNISHCQLYSIKDMPLMRELTVSENTSRKTQQSWFLIQNGFNANHFSGDIVISRSTLKITI